MPSSQCDDDAIRWILMEIAGKLGTGYRVERIHGYDGEALVSLRLLEP